MEVKDFFSSSSQDKIIFNSRFPNKFENLHDTIGLYTLNTNFY